MGLGTARRPALWMTAAAGLLVVGCVVDLGSLGGDYATATAMNETGVNQDGCQGATLTLHLTNN